MTAHLPTGPLIDYLTQSGIGTTPLELHRLTGIDRSIIHKQLRRGRLRWDSADRIATRLGLHPTEIWGDQWLTRIDLDYVERSNRIDNAFRLLREDTA